MVAKCVQDLIFRSCLGIQTIVNIISYDKNKRT